MLICLVYSFVLIHLIFIADKIYCDDLVKQSIHSFIDRIEHFIKKKLLLVIFNQFSKNLSTLS